MKQTKRPLSVLLTLCLLLGLMPTAARAYRQAEITQQPTVENNYTVVAEYNGSQLTEGFQWYKKLDTSTTYTLVKKGEATGEDDLEVNYANSGTYANGYWTAQEWDSTFNVEISYEASFGDRVTVRIPADQVSDALIVEDYDDNSFQKTGNGIYTATFGSGWSGIYMESDREFTAVITVERFNREPLSEETSPSLQTRDPGTYYCQVEHVSGTMFSDTVTILSPEEQATADWLANDMNILTLGPVEVTADNAKDILGNGKASFAVVDGTPILTLSGVDVTEGMEMLWVLCGLLCSGELTIELAEGSVNRITLSDVADYDMAAGVMVGIFTENAADSYLTITGKGKLEVSFTSSDKEAASLEGVFASNIHVTGGAEFTVICDTPEKSETPGEGIHAGIGLSSDTLRVSDGGVVKISSTSMAAAIMDMDGKTPKIVADGYSIRGSTAANDFDSLTDAELKEIKENFHAIVIGDEIAKSVVIAPHTHAWDTAWSKNDTHHWHECTAADCPVTDDADKDGYAAHNAVTDKAEDATCTTDGKTEGSHCSVCGYVITPQQSIPASHTWGKWTLQADGKTVKRVCTADPSHTESKTLAITLDKSSYTYSGGENKPTVIVKVGGTALTLGTDYTVSYKNNVNKGTATVTVTGKGSYAGSTDTTFAVTAKPLTATAATATDRVYDGTAAVTVTAVALDGVVGRDNVAVNTTGLKGTVSSPNASDTPYETVSLNGLTLTGAAAGNYTLPQVNVTLPTSVTISKATPPTATAVSRNITNKLAKEYTFALANLLPQLNQEGITENRKDWGSPVYTIQNVDIPDGYYDGETAPARILREDGMAILHLPIRFNDVETTGEVGSITVEIRSANYETFSNVLSIRANNKTSVQFEGISIDSRPYNGQPIAYTGVLAVKTDDGTDVTANIPAEHIEITYRGVDGTAYGGDRSKIPPTNAGSFVMVVRMADEDENYIGVTQFPFVISKATGRGSVTMADFTCGGEPSVPVPTSDTNGVEGVSYVYKVRGAADETYSTIKPVAPGTYTVRASFPAATNYQAVTATADFTVSHAWADTWSTDAAGHWHACTSCGETKDNAEHVYGSDQEVICAACGYDRTVTGDQTKGEVELKPGTDTPEVTTDTEALKDLAGEIHGWQTVTVKLIVEKQDEPADKDEITELVTGKKDDVLYLDLSLLRQVNTEAPEAITDTGSKVLEIAVTYDFTGKKDVTVYRKHGNTPAAALTGLTERPDGAFSDGTFYTDTVNGKVYIYASKFSTYAIGYTARTGSSGIYYTLTATAGQGGSISPGGEVSLRRNETKPFAIIPDEGYRVADVLVDGKSVGPVTEYTFERITADHTIEAVFRKTTSGAAGCARDSTCPISKFPDTETEAWYHDGVHYCIENGLMSGYDGNRFGPNDTLTRGMLAQILYNEAGRPAVTGNSPFDDVAADAWYADAVTWAAKEGIVEGYGNGSFGPEDAITREQLAAMLHRHAQAEGRDVSVGEDTNILSYKDFDRISEWAIPALQWAVGSGIVTGKDGGILDPTGQATRAEAAAMLQRLLEREP